MTISETFTPTRRDAELATWASMYAVSELSLIRTTGQGGTAYAQLQVCPSGARYRSVIENLTPRQARELTNGYHANFHHPVLYAKALRIGAVRLAELVPMSASLRRLLIAAPAVAATADITENLVNLYIHDDVERITNSTATLSSVLSILKWSGTVGPLVYMSTQFLPVWGRAIAARLPLR
ncbi:MAG: hypothetical protein WBF79_17145 [Rhodococcus sp. (in: high G+C Gram-positive bacteria)]